MAQAEKTSTKAKLADRLISGLSGEFQRWTLTIKELTISEGDMLHHTFFHKLVRISSMNEEAVY